MDEVGAAVRRGHGRGLARWGRECDRWRYKSRSTRRTASGSPILTSDGSIPFLNHFKRPSNFLVHSSTSPIYPYHRFASASSTVLFLLHGSVVLAFLDAYLLLMTSKRFRLFPSLLCSSLRFSILLLLSSPLFSVLSSASVPPSFLLASVDRSDTQCIPKLPSPLSIDLLSFPL